MVFGVDRYGNFPFLLSSLAAGLYPGPDPGPQEATIPARQGGRARHAVPPTEALIAARRPWGKVFHAQTLSKPPSLREAIARMRRNTAYFRANYALAVVAVFDRVVASQLWHPSGDDALHAPLLLRRLVIIPLLHTPRAGGQPMGSSGCSLMTAPCSPRSGRHHHRHAFHQRRVE